MWVGTIVRFVGKEVHGTISEQCGGPILASLQHLYLRDTKVTDVGLKKLKRLTSLQSLDLRRTKVSDAGLEHLKKLTKLQKLDIQNTQVTDEGVKKLQQALPKCTIQC